MSTLHKNLAYRIASILVSLLFVLLAYIFQIPNPMMLLILPVIYFTFSEGYIAGALSAVIMGAYGLWFFSTPGHLFVYDTVNVQKVVMIVIALLVTVTLIGNLKARLLAMEAQEAAVKARNDFLSRMSHDIRTPLNGILGMTRLARGNRILPWSEATWVRLRIPVIICWGWSMISWIWRRLKAGK